MAHRPMLNLTTSALAQALLESVAPITRTVETVELASGRTREVEVIVPELAREAILRLRNPKLRTGSTRKLAAAFARRGVSADALAALVNPTTVTAVPTLAPEPAGVSFATFIAAASAPTVAPTPVAALPALPVLPEFTGADLAASLTAFGFTPEQVANVLAAQGLTPEISIMPASPAITPVVPSAAPKAPRRKSVATSFAQRVADLAPEGQIVRFGMRASKLAKQDQLTADDIEMLSDAECLAIVQNPIRDTDTLKSVLVREGCL